MLFLAAVVVVVGCYCGFHHLNFSLLCLIISLPYIISPSLLYTVERQHQAIIYYSYISDEREV